MVQQVCIASDVQGGFLVLAYQDVAYIRSFGLEKLGADTPLITLRDDLITSLKDELHKAIDDLLPKREKDFKRSQSVVLVKYRNVDINLNLRDSLDFSIASLIDILDMCLFCETLNGTLSIYNRILFAKYNSLSIISYLRVHYQLSIQKILDGILHVDGMCLEMLESGLDHLQWYGLVSYDKYFNVYKLTARGYLLY